MEQFGPLVGFSLSLALLLGTLTVFCLMLWISVPFVLFGMRRQLSRQVEVLARIEHVLRASASTAQVEPQISPASPDLPLA